MNVFIKFTSFAMSCLLLFAAQRFENSFRDLFRIDGNHPVVLELLHLLRPQLDHLKPRVVLEIILGSKSELIVIAIEPEMTTRSSRDEFIRPSNPCAPGGRRNR